MKHLKLKPDFKKIRKWSRRAKKYITPGKKTLKGAAWGILIVAVLVHFFGSIGYARHIGLHNWALFMVAMLAAFLLAAFLAESMLRQLNRLPRLLMIALVTGVAVAMFSFYVNTPTFLFMLGLLLFLSAFIGAAAWLIYRGYYKKARRSYKVLIIIAGLAGLAGLAGGTWWFIHPGKSLEAPANAALLGKHLPAHISLENPAAPGSFIVGEITYGSGTDKHRAEYGAQAGLISRTVDGTRFLDAWTGLSGKLRTRYFGFGRDSLPLNGRVWYPMGEGPFPLVLIVHGNHLAQDFSDPGYEYLGRLMASRGFVFVSVDQNFVNGSFTNLFKGLRNENDVRGWLMLKHIELWNDWNDNIENRFFNRIDMDRIALIGHSRGGEAVAHAALFNRLPFYPDNAKEVFDFNFNIRSVVAIAPVDGQYQPAGIHTPLRDINYFVLQGSHDADMQSYQGLRQYNRISFSDGFAGFKAGLYIYNANHGQFNTSWGRKDFSSPRINFVNIRQLMPGEDQQMIAKVFISGFLEATLNKNTAYKSLFMDHRTGRDWLPEHIMMNQFEDASTRYICNFREDVNLATATLPGVSIESDRLTVWREQMIKIKWGNQDDRAVYLGWHRNENDSLFASYTLNLNDAAVADTKNKLLVFSLADANENSNPDPVRKNEKDGTESNDNINEPGDNNNNATPSDGNDADKDKDKDKGKDKGKEKDKQKEKEPIDFSIWLEDAKGSQIKIALSDCRLLQPRLTSKMGKLPFMATAPDTETIPDFFYFSLEQITGMKPEFDSNSLARIRFVFDRTNEGVVIMNNIGLMDDFR